MISTHTPHARRDKSKWNKANYDEIISTHTPHARRDKSKWNKANYDEIISTHTPHARRDDLAKGQRFTVWEFQLTRLMRGVTSASIS